MKTKIQCVNLEKYTCWKIDWISISLILWSIDVFHCRGNYLLLNFIWSLLKVFYDVTLFFAWTTAMTDTFSNRSKAFFTQMHVLVSLLFLPSYLCFLRDLSGLIFCLLTHRTLFTVTSWFEHHQMRKIPFFFDRIR